MSFKKLGNNNYYNDELFVKMYSQNGEYFLDLVNGGTIKLTSTEYNGLISGLTAINGVYYYYSDIITKLYIDNGKYYIVFNNNMVYETTQGAYESLIATNTYILINGKYYYEKLIAKFIKLDIGKYKVLFTNGSEQKLTRFDFENAIGDHYLEKNKTYVFKDVLSPDNVSADIKFTSNSDDFLFMEFEDGTLTYGEEDVAYTDGEWEDNAFKTIAVANETIDYSDIDESFINWLEKNTTKS